MAVLAVIGAGYGDEGKGLLVDALAASSGAAVVVRSNGGAQAGHTVVAPDGRRHVFHHVGAGALAGAATHLSRFFVHHPMLFLAERAAVAALGGEVRVAADPRGAVTTPYDVAANQAAEVARGGGRHGSCGLGFGETVGRDGLPGHRLRVADLAGPGLRARLAALRDAWLPARLAALGTSLAALGPEVEAAVRGDAVLDRFLADCADYLDAVAVEPDAGLGRRGGVVFEGAQGLMLDQDRGAFPHVTRSCTGMANVAAIAAEAGLGPVDATYVTRAYVTRHGAGPLAREGAVPFDVLDPTNAPNPWQGTLRTATLDLAVLAAAVRADLAAAPGAVRAASLAVTCLDQARAGIPYGVAGRIATVAAGDACEVLAAAAGLLPGHGGWGPSRADLVPARAGARAA